jgi:hypothetical protein
MKMENEPPRESILYENEYKYHTVYTSSKKVLILSFKPLLCASLTEQVSESWIGYVSIACEINHGIVLPSWYGLTIKVVGIAVS